MGRLAGVASLLVLLAAGVLLCGEAWAQTAPSIPVNALPITPKTTYGSNINYQVNGSNATITQTAPTNIVRWNSFDIGSAASVNIVQPSSTAVLLNKVDGGAYLNKTTIDGMLNANGRVYIYNPNGVLFGKTATVNVDTLIASSLKFDETRVIGGLLQPGQTPVLGADPNYSGVPGDVQVEGDAGGHATLNSSNGGLILLAAPNVVNNGLLNAPDGQVIIAAGSKVYLAAPNVGQTGTSLRGLLVEVSNPTATAVPLTASGGTSTAENGVAGQITVGQGNATMIGYAVNQMGIISATTSVNLNGSIYLYARDQAVLPDANGSWQASRTGNLVLGPDSVTEVLPTLSDTSTISATTTFNKSDVKLDGVDIQLQQNASIVAPGGDVAITARSLANNAISTNPDGTPHILDPATDIVRVDFAPGSLIDVSGSGGTQLPMSSNVISVDLRGTELADNPVLRNSPLYGTTVNIDIRKGTPVANISGWLDLIQYNLGQMNAAGGTVNVSADGAIIQRAGSKINVDGGWVDYQSGYVNTTQLQFGDKLVDIGSATANTLYTAAVNLPNGPNNYEIGYRQGSSAGTVNFSAPIVVQQGDLSGQATVGPLQRDVTAVGSLNDLNGPISKVVFGYPQGGQLQIGDVSDWVNPQTGKANISAQINASDRNPFVYTGNLQIGGTATETAAPPAVDAPFALTNADQSLLATSLNLDPAVLALAGFSRITALTSGNIDVAVPVKLAPGGHLWLGAGQSLLNTTPGGGIQFNALVTIPGGSLTAAASGILQVADGTDITLAGLWINDQILASPALDANGNRVTPLVLKGGALSLFANQLLVGNNVSADVSAGAWLDGKAKTTQGSAGSITLEADPLDSSVPSNAFLQLGSGLSLSGYGFTSGGTLKLVGRNVFVGAPSAGADPNDLWLQPAFFQQGGFTSYDIAANVNFEMLANMVTPLASSWLFNTMFATLSSGAMSTAATPYLFDLSGPVRTRPATNVTFRALSQRVAGAGRLMIDDGANLALDPGANLSLYAGRQLTVDGSLSAPAGKIILGLTASASTAPFDPARSIWFGPNASILARGSRQRLYTNADGVTSGEVLDGGTIQIGYMQNGVLSAADGYVVAEPGSVFDVSGAAALGLYFKSNGAITPKQDVASSGGSIEIRALEGLLFDGTLKGSAGGAGASGGSLTVALDRDTLGPEGILTILPNDNGSIVPTNLDPNNVPPGISQLGQNIVVDKTGTGALSGQDFWVLTSSSSLTTISSLSNAKSVGEGWIPATSFSHGGFGRLDFKSQDVLAFGLGSSDLTLSAKDALILDAPTLRAFNNSANNSTTTSSSNSHTLTLSAPYIELGSADENWQLPDASSTGNAQLDANGTTIDLIGNSSLQGFSAANLNAKADIRLAGFSTVDANNQTTGYSQGSLVMTGNLTLTDAQTYPTTLNDYTFMVAGNGTDATSGTLTFASNGNIPQQVLSAGGSLTAIAPHIIQDGQVVAPFGSITMGNLDSTWSPSVVYGALFDPSALINPDNRTKAILTTDLKYKSGSVTSVAGSGVVPFGNVINGSVPSASTWGFGGTTTFSLVQSSISGGGLPERPLPGKAIISNAQIINADSGSVQDLSGGGSLLAFEFTPGKGGSKDVLDSATTFAINPNFQGSVAPIDSNYGSVGLKPGDSVYLSGIPGLPAGTYTLLPAHYALLPGGYSVTMAANTRDMQSSSNTVLADGSMLVAGHLTESGSATGSTRSNGFIVSSGSVVSSKSEFTIYDVTSYFTGQAMVAGVAVPELPVDGGYIAFNATGTNSSALVMDSIIRLGAATRTVIDPTFNNTTWTGAIGLSAASGGRAGMADISAPQIEVVSDTSQNTGNAIQLVANSLTALGADSLLLGGLRDTGNGSTHLTVGASNVTIGSNAQLIGPEVMIVANDSINLDSGVSLQSSGTLGYSPQNLTLDGGGALLRVSSGGPVSVTRATTFTTGTLNIATGATVTAGGSAYLDATGGVKLAGQLTMVPGSALGLGAPGISIGSNIPALDTNLQLGTDMLKMFSGLSYLSLNSYASPIDLYGTVNLALASTTHSSLSFQGTGFQGDGGTVNFAADTVSFTGTPASAAATTFLAAPSGKLAVQANTLKIGNNAFAIHGYADSTLTALGELMAVGTAGQLAVDQNLKLVAGLIDTASASSASFIAGRNMVLTQVANPLTTVASPGMGGQLNFAAANITSDALIEVPTGKVVMSGSNGIDIGGGQISTAGRSVVFGSTIAYGPGGIIILTGGDVTVAEQAVLDVSAVGAAAGALSITATKADGSATVELSGTLKGGATAGGDSVVPTQGQFSLVTDQSNGGTPNTPLDFGTLNAQLNAAGFTGSRQFDFRNGDITLGGSDSIIAHQLVIAADNGNIVIGGNAIIDASGAEGGSIALYASQPTASGSSGNVTLSGNAQLLANATSTVSGTAGSTGNGGKVIIGTGSADGLNPNSVSGGSSINLSGGIINVGGSNANGTVTLRAPRVGTGGGNDVAVTSLNTDIQNSSATVIEGYNVYQASTIMGTDPVTNNLAGVNLATNLDPSTSGIMYTDASSFMSNQPGILNRVNSGASAASNLSINPGSEVRSTGDLNVSVNEFAASAADRGWNLDTWRFGADLVPVTLTLRAAGNLNIIGSISDGFLKPSNAALAMPDWSLGTGASASYRFAGGANLEDANPLAVNTRSGNVYFGFADRIPKSYVEPVDILNKAGDVLATINVTVPYRSTDGSLTSGKVTQAQLNALLTNSDAPVALVRTGTGSIDIAAGNNFTLGMAKFFVNDSSNLKIDASVFSSLGIKGNVYINDITNPVVSSPNINGAVFSDPVLNGTPVIYDSVNSSTGAYQVSLYGASVYTAGQATSLADFTAPQNVLNSRYGARIATKSTPSAASGAAFGSGGGAIIINAGGNVYGPQNLSGSWSYQNADYVAAVPYDPASPAYPAVPAIPSTTAMLPSVVPQLVNDWLFRQGSSYVDANGNVVFEVLGNGSTLNTAWWSRYDYFNAGIATFGGGDVQVTAAGDVRDLSASVATNAYMPGTAPTSLVEHGGGNLLVRAGGDILGGSFYVQKGAATLRADGSVTAGDYVPSASSSITPLNPVLALGDATVNVTAGDNVAIETAYNPMLTEQSVNNVNGARMPGLPGLNPIYGLLSAGSPYWDVTNMTNAAIRYRQTYAQFSDFSTYGANSAVSLTAVGGDLLLSNDAGTLASVGGNDIQNQFVNTSGNVFPNLYVLEPATFSAAALSGNLTSSNGFIMMPSPQGQLDLLAAGSINMTDGPTGAIRMLDINPGTLPDLYSPHLLNTADVNVLNGSATGIAAHMLGGLHTNDATPVEIVAVTGDITGDSNNAATVILPKFAEILAGMDIVNLSFSIQQNSAADVTTVTAGRDFIETTSAAVQQYNVPSSMKNIVTGPGRIDISAGRNVDFGNRGGLVTRGNLDNPYLPDVGAGINIVAGAQPNYVQLVSWLAQYGSVNNLTPLPTTLTTSEQNDLIAYMRSLQPDLPVSLTADAALEAFLKLSLVQQSPFLVMESAANIQALAKFVSAAEQSNLMAYVVSLKPGLSSNLTPETALDAFSKLTITQQNHFLVNYADTYDLAAYVRLLKPDLSFVLTDAGAHEAFSTLSTAQQTSFLDKHTDILALAGSTAPVGSVWSAFRSLNPADQATFLNEHSDVTANLAANATKLSTSLAAADQPQLNTSFFSSLVDVSKQSSLSNFDSLIASLYPSAKIANDLVSYMRSLQPLLPANLTPAEALADFRQLASAQQIPFLVTHPLNSLTNMALYYGNIDVFSSQIKTEQGGAINLFAPTGSVYAGLTTGISGKSPSTQGLFTVRGGAIASLVKNDFLVNQGRVFTLGGGDVTLVSQYNDISAGKGAKTAASAPPPLITIDPNGNINVDVSGSISGSGIATLKTNPDKPAGNIYVIAPRGIFDAGDAGVRSSGSVQISASEVLNGANISAAGAVSGAPTTVAAPSLGNVAAPSGTNQNADEVTKGLNNASSAAANSLSVEVLGYGDDKSPSDGACNDSTLNDGSCDNSRRKKKS